MLYLNTDLNSNSAWHFWVEVKLCTNMLETDIYVVASMRKTFMDSAIMELVSIWP